jgi:DNA-binding PadR family transcriptional regulator
LSTRIRAVSPTRLLVLGCVRIFQPAHGYLIRQELLSWHADEWAHLNPGSIYNALRSLTKQGFLEEVGTEAAGGRPARTTYRLTPAGEEEFQALLRAGLTELAPHEPANLLAAWSFSWALPRSEVIEALEGRLEQITGHASQTAIAIAGIDDAEDVPAHVVEHLRLSQARMDGEAAWVVGVLERLRAGDYWYEGEPNRPWSAPASAALRHPDHHV